MLAHRRKWITWQAWLRFHCHVLRERSAAEYRKLMLTGYLLLPQAPCCCSLRQCHVKSTLLHPAWSCKESLCSVTTSVTTSSYCAGTYRALNLWRDNARELWTERNAVKLQRAAMLCFGSYCQRAMHSWRHAVWLRRTLRRGLQSREVVVLDQCASQDIQSLVRCPPASTRKGAPIDRLSGYCGLVCRCVADARLDLLAGCDIGYVQDPPT